MVIEAIFFIDIVMKFFLQKFDERGKPEVLPLEEVAHKYLTTGFLLDFVCFLPLGWIFSLIDERFKFMWLIKTLRISTLSYYLRQKFYDEMIEYYIEMRQSKSLKDDEKKFEINEDLTFIS